MRTLVLSAVLAAVVVAAAACGDSGDREAKPLAGKTVRGETQRGMTLTVETFAAADDVMLKRIEPGARRQAMPPWTTTS